MVATSPTVDTDLHSFLGNFNYSYYCSHGDAIIIKNHYVTIITIAIRIVIDVPAAMARTVSAYSHSTTVLVPCA